MNFRAGVAVVLLALLALEILPCSVVESPAAASAPAAVTCRFEPLQVCGDGDPLLGALANLLVLVPAAPVVVPSPEVLGLAPAGVVFVPSGFTPPIDHPPQLSA